MGRSQSAINVQSHQGFARSRPLPTVSAIRSRWPSGDHGCCPEGRAETRLDREQAPKRASWHRSLHRRHLRDHRPPGLVRLFPWRIYAGPFFRLASGLTPGNVTAFRFAIVAEIVAKCLFIFLAQTSQRARLWKTWRADPVWVTAHPEPIKLRKDEAWMQNRFQGAAQVQDRNPRHLVRCELPLPAWGRDSSLRNQRMAQLMERESDSARRDSTRSARGLGPRSPLPRWRTLTVPASASLGPTTSM